MSENEKLLERKRAQEARAPAAAADSGPSPLLEQAAQHAAVAEQASRQCDSLGNVEEELLRRKNLPGE
ncbi:MAG: hypothetical protein HY812_19800 [Planctomycetes bacterium]|nr:hypothetical protein [Planctomycetota bacterium]